MPLIRKSTVRGGRISVAWRAKLRFWTWAAALPLLLGGCGRIVAQKATEQLLASDAVDRSISQIDFRVLTGKKVFLDTQYVNKAVPGTGYVTSEYIISAVRQKMMGDGCLLQDKAEESDFVVEMRVGAVGADGHEVIYGMPANNFLGLAATAMQTPPAAAAAMPTVPEISLAKKADQMAASKLGLFAYNRKTREPIWQSGLSEARSTVDDRWYFGAGPFHKGNIHTAKKKPQIEAPIFETSMEEETGKADFFVQKSYNDASKSLAAQEAAKTAAAAAAVAAAPAPAVAKPADAKPASAPAAGPAPAPAPATAAAPKAQSNSPNVANNSPAKEAPAEKKPENSSAQAPPAKDAKPTAAANVPAPTGGAVEAKPAAKPDQSMTAAERPVSEAPAAAAVAATFGSSKRHLDSVGASSVIMGG